MLAGQLIRLVPLKLFDCQFLKCRNVRMEMTFDTIPRAHFDGNLLSI